MTMTKPLNGPIGVMQGRLLPKYKGRYQAHPQGYWADEFLIAYNLGLDCIEFIVDFNDVDLNPLLAFSGVDDIKRVIDNTGVLVKTICADYFMEAPLHSPDSAVRASSIEVLKSLIQSARQIGVTEIVIPCVDNSSIVGKESTKRLVSTLHNVLPVVEKANLHLSLETDLSPNRFIDLLELVDSSHVTVNYDIGNSAALGYDTWEEILCYGHKITDVHIKDRVLNGEPTVLGEGSANIEETLRALRHVEYDGPLIMQAFRDDEGVEIFKRQLDYFNEKLVEVAGF